MDNELVSYWAGGNKPIFFTEFQLDHLRRMDLYDSRFSFALKIPYPKGSIGTTGIYFAGLVDGQASHGAVVTHKLIFQRVVFWVPKVELSVFMGGSIEKLVFIVGQSQNRSFLYLGCNFGVPDLVLYYLVELPDPSSPVLA